MNKLEELDKKAFTLQELPERLNMPETYYFLTMRALYAMFLTKKISGEQAKREKKQTIGCYNAFELAYRIGEHDLSVLQKIQSNKDYYSEKGCPVCKQLANQICGLAIELTEEFVEVV